MSVVARLFVMLVMSLGLATLMSSPASAQETQTVQCQTIIDGVIDQDDCEVTVNDDGSCQVVLPDGAIVQNVGCSPEGCPQQVIDADGNIFQFQCGGVVLPTAVPSTAVPPTATVAPDVTPTATPVTPGVTQTPVTPNVTQAPEVPDEEEPVDVLPDTGQGSSSSQSNSANMLLLGAMSTVLALGAIALRLRSNR